MLIGDQPRYEPRPIATTETVTKLNITDCYRISHSRQYRLYWMHGRNSLPKCYLTPTPKMRTFFQICSLIHSFNLAAILRSIAFPFVFLYIIYSESIDYLSQSNFTLPEFLIIKPYQSPLFTINEELQSFTIKNLKQLQSSPNRIKKQSLIDSYLILL